MTARSCERSRAAATASREYWAYPTPAPRRFNPQKLCAPQKRVATDDEGKGMKQTRTGRKAKIAIVSGALALSMGLASQSASAHKVAFDNNLQLKDTALTETTSQYSGKVTSIKGACKFGRPVTVTANGVVIASAFSVAGGAWSASGPTQVKGTTLIASIPRKILKRNKKHRHKCKAASAQRRAN